MTTQEIYDAIKAAIEGQGSQIDVGGVLHKILYALNEAIANGYHYEVYASTEEVDEPNSHTLYLIGPIGEGEDKYEEYVYVDKWIKVGEASVDLSGYVTTAVLKAAIADFITKEDTLAYLLLKEDKSNKVTEIDENSTNNQYPSAKCVYDSIFGAIEAEY